MPVPQSFLALASIRSHLLSYPQLCLQRCICWRRLFSSALASPTILRPQIAMPHQQPQKRQSQQQQQQQNQRSITSFFAKAPATGGGGSPLRSLAIAAKPTEAADAAAENGKAAETKQPLEVPPAAANGGVKTKNATAALVAGSGVGKRKKAASESESEHEQEKADASDKARSEESSLEESREESQSQKPKSPPAKRRRRMISSSSSQSDTSDGDAAAPASVDFKQQTKKTLPAKREAKKPMKRAAKNDDKTPAAAKADSKLNKGQKAKGQEQKKDSPPAEKVVKEKANKTSPVCVQKNNDEKVDTSKDNKDSEAKKVPGGDNSNDSAGYNPGKPRYDPIADAIWSHGEPVPYLALAKTFEAIEATPGRLRILELLCNFLRSVRLLSPSDLLPCVYLCLNQLAPAYEAVELGVGDSVLMKAMALSTGSTVDKIRQRAQVVGDLGAVSESLRSRQAVMCRPKPLTVAGVFQRLREVADLAGNAAQQKKVAKIQSLLVSCRQCEAKYLIRSLSGRLRIGLAELSVLSALGHAFARSPDAATPDAARGQPADAWKRRQDEAALLVRTAYCRCPNYRLLTEALLAEGGLSGLLDRCQLHVGLPLKPMLAHPTRGVHEVLKRFEGVGAFTCEFKYDGERAQIHRLPDGSVRVYSRNQENNTSKYPDIAARVPDLLRDRPEADFIIDAEAVAYDPEKKQILPFQVLTTRKRKDADADTIKVQVCVFAFDILYYNGQSLVEKSLRERRRVLRDSFNFEATQAAGHFALADWQDCTDTEEIQGFLEEAIRGNCEGLMLKALDTEATYEIAKRSHSWLKLKKDYVDGVGDTLDLVVVGGYHGTGKRAGKLGGFLLACYHPEDEEYQTVCKIGTGFSDEDLDAFTRDLGEHRLPAPRPYVRCGQAEADIWFDPAVVWEVKAADLSLSPAYVAALGLADARRGISLRFPRFVRRREDKRPEEATTAAQLADMYRSQEIVKSAAAAGQQANEEEDYY